MNLELGNYYLFTDKIYGYFKQSFKVRLFDWDRKGLLYVENPQGGTMWVKDYELTELPVKKQK